MADGFASGPVLVKRGDHGVVTPVSRHTPDALCSSRISHDSAAPHKEQAAKQSAGYGWRHFIAGGIGGMFGATLTCPLEVVKTRLQSKALAAEIGNGGIVGVARNIVRMDGVVGFWKVLHASGIGRDWSGL